MMDGDLQVLRREDQEDHRDEHTVEGERDHVRREHANAKEEYLWRVAEWPRCNGAEQVGGWQETTQRSKPASHVEVRLVQRRQARLGDALPRRRPELHRPARPATLLLPIRLVVRRDFVRALDVIPTRAARRRRCGRRSSVRRWSARTLQLTGGRRRAPPNKVPALEKGAERQIHVLHERARVPAACGGDARLAPHAASAVEVEEVA